MSSSDNEGAPLLGLAGLGIVVDQAKVTSDIAGEWGLILASGIISLVAGIFALMSPVTATVFVVTFLSCALIVVGVFSMLGVFFTEQHYRCPTFVMGAAQLALGICMLRNIVTSMVVLTGIVAVLYMILGVFHCFLACGNTGMPGYGSYLTSGICSILFSVIVLSAFPTSSVYTLGIILGVNWVTSGIFRIAVGFSGRSEAKTLMAAVPGSIV